MSVVYVDATTLISLGTVGELDLLTNVDGRVAVQDRVRNEVTTEPARTNVERFCSRGDTVVGEATRPGEDPLEDGRSLLGDGDETGDVHLVAAVLERTGRGESTGAVGVVSDDARVRTVADGLGATVTGTVGVVVRAVHEGLNPEAAKDVIRRIDDNGLHMTGELRETAYRLVDEASEGDWDR